MMSHGTKRVNEIGYIFLGQSEFHSLTLDNIFVLENESYRIVNFKLMCSNQRK